MDADLDFSSDGVRWVFDILRRSPDVPHNAEQVADALTGTGDRAVDLITVKSRLELLHRRGHLMRPETGWYVFSPNHDTRCDTGFIQTTSGVLVCPKCRRAKVAVAEARKANRYREVQPQVAPEPAVKGPRVDTVLDVYLNRFVTRDELLLPAEWEPPPVTDLHVHLHLGSARVVDSDGLAALVRDARHVTVHGSHPHVLRAVAAAITAAAL